MKHIPNALTVLNLIAGVSGIVFIFMDHTNLTLICAAVALVADLFDGFVARALNVQSNMGKELDSLADVISFGALPSAILAYEVVRCDEYGLWMVPLAALIAAGTALRLAKFNLDTRDSSVFYGLPSPASAAIVFSFLLLSYTNHEWAQSFQCQSGLFFGLIILLPFLMLSDVRLWSFKGLQGKNGKAILGLFIAVLAVSVAITGVGGFLITAGVYILLGLLNRLINVY